MIAAPKLALYGTLWPLAGLPRNIAIDLLSRRTGKPCHVLAIDQARRSGWGVHDLTRIVLHGHAQTSVQRREALKRMRQLPGFDLSHLLVVFEDHSTMPVTRNAKFNYQTREGPTRNTATILGMGAARGRWEELLDILEHPHAQRIQVEPCEWRRVLGTRVNLGTEGWKAQACMWATGATGGRIEDDNEAEACVMATWGACDGLARWAQDRAAQHASEARTARRA